jgi:hypothetical protein
VLKIYTKLKTIEDNGKSSLFPLLDILIDKDINNLSAFYSLTEEIKNADILILPYFYDFLIKEKKTEIFNNLLKLSIKERKPFWIAIGSDLPLTINYKNVYVFKMTGFKSKLQPRNFIMPVFIGDPISRFYDEVFETQPKSKIPKIGYVGHAKSGLVKYLRTIYIYLNYNFKVFLGKIISDYSPLYYSSHIRYRYLKSLEKSSKLNCNFLYRDKYKAGAKTKLEKEKATTDFYENIRNTQYTFCIRGGGNFSVRLYETMAMGRIPIQIDTDCILPLEDVLDWKSHILIIPEKDIYKADLLICNFHNSCTDLEFKNFQLKVRNFWKNNLTREKYFIHIHNIFEK